LGAVQIHKPLKKVAFIFSRFPSIWQTYLSREIDGLIKKGLPIVIFSLKNKKWEKVQSEALEIENKIRIIRGGYLFSLSVIISNLRYIFTNPIKYCQILFFIIKNSARGKKTTLLKNLIIFPMSVSFSYKMKEEKVCHIHATHASYPALIAYIISGLTGIPYSFTGHASDIYADITMLGNKIGKAKFIITCTDENIKYLRRSFPETKNKDIFLNYHGIRLDRFPYIDKRSFDQIRILSVGRIEESKGYHNLIEANRILKENGVNFKTVIIGDGPIKNKLIQMIIKYKLEDNIVITGVIPYDDVIKYYKSANIFVLVAINKYHYGIPNVLIEAMASGLPVITTRLPAVENELIKHGENGILVEENSPYEIAESIKYINRNANERERMILNARKTIEENFDFQNNINQLYSIFLQNIR